MTFIPLPCPAWAQKTVRVGSFANITHAQALVGKARGDFEKALGPAVKVQWTTFNAGPAAIEALFANAIDMTYVGPNPALTGYIRSQGEALRIIAGATSGGAALVVRGDSGIQEAADFHGKRVASPQQGNTQDVALRAWLRAHGLKPRDKGGDVQVFPIANADQLNLFLKRQLDAAWAPEPWATRLIHEAHARLFLDERTLWPGGQFVTTVLVANPRFVRENPELVERWLRAHIAVTEWINQNLSQAREIVNRQIKKDSNASLAPPVLEEAFARLQVTYDPLRASLQQSARWAYEEGFLGRRMPDISGIYDLSLLNQVLKQEGRKGVP